jgi:AcrR family transcriptional regulator
MSDDGKRNGREAKKAHAEQQILEHAARLFVEKGFGGTSLKDIADAMGLTRGAIYYYFPNKEALLSTLVEDLTINAAKDIDLWREAAQGSPAERLRGLVRHRVSYVLQRGFKIRILDLAEAALPEGLARRSRSAKRHILGVYVSIIHEGVRSGVFRPVDERVAAFGLIGMVNWTAWWFDPNKGRSAGEIAEDLAGMAVRSLLRDEGREAAHSPEALIRQLRDDLGQLERLVAKGASKAE